MKKVIYLLFAVLLCINVSAQVKSTNPTEKPKGKGSSLSTGPKAKATALFVGKSTGTITASQLSTATALNMSDNSIPSSFKLTLSCAGSNNVSYSNTQNNELTKEMKALFARSAVGCTITFSDIVVNGKTIDPIKLTIN